MFQNKVFIFSLAAILLLVGIGLVSPPFLENMASVIHGQIIHYFGWFYHLAAIIFFIFVLFLAFSRYGQVRLGRDDEKPQYSDFGWFSMLFAAGMGIGLIFWGVAEPLSHFMNPPEHIEEGSGYAASFAMRYCFFHWGLHPWAIYVVISLTLAYFSFRRGMPPLISSCFYPLLGDRIYHTPGKIIDILAVVATVFGVATSLGLGALQIGSGMEHILGFASSPFTPVIIIAVVTVLFLISSTIGLDRGIQTLSKLNMYLAFLLLLFMLLVGPTVFIINVFISTLGDYMGNFIAMSLQTNPFQGYDWTNTWTIFYWAWWISWSPFVGLFIARISRGRTIKEFILGVLLVPTLLSMIWFSVFGGTALYLEINQAAGIASSALQDVSTVLFMVFSYFPLSNLLALTAIILLVVFFITSADSATFVLGMMTSEGRLNPSTPKKITWGLTLALLATVLLWSGGLVALQQMAIAGALPFTLIMLLLCYNLFTALGEEEVG